MDNLADFSNLTSNIKAQAGANKAEAEERAKNDLKRFLRGEVDFELDSFMACKVPLLVPGIG